MILLKFKGKLFNSKGFIFIEAIFLTLIISFMAILILNGLETAVRSNRISAIRTAALHIANAQMSEVEEYISMNKTTPSSDYTLLTSEDLERQNFFGINGTLKFNVETQIQNSSLGSELCNVTIKVTWTVNDNEEYINGTDRNYEEIKKDIWIYSND